MSEQNSEIDVEIEETSNEPQDLSSSVTTLDEPVWMTVVCEITKYN